MNADIQDILGISAPKGRTPLTKDLILGANKKKKSLKKSETAKKPDGMHRELWGLLQTDNKDAPPVIPTNTGHHGYKQVKAKLGRSKVRPWTWMPFANPGRKDGAILYHWRREEDSGKEYPFARFNKAAEVPTFSDADYELHIRSRTAAITTGSGALTSGASPSHSQGWTREETMHLFDLAQKFDLRFFLIHDRWDRERFRKRSTEELKERYYDVCNILAKVRSGPDGDPKVVVFDAEHERRRKEQLTKLFNRTKEQIEEEQYLVSELKKIDLRKKEREKKQQDLQKLILAVDASDTKRPARSTERSSASTAAAAAASAGHVSIGSTAALKRKQISISGGLPPDLAPAETTGLKFPEIRSSGATLRSQLMKLPNSLGQKKTKIIEQALEELSLDQNPVPSEEIADEFNALRQDILLLYEQKLAYSNCQFELQTLRHRLLELAPDKVPQLDIVISSTQQGSSSTTSPTRAATARKVCDVFDTLTPVGITPSRKRRAAAEQSTVLQKLKRRAL